MGNKFARTSKSCYLCGKITKSVEMKRLSLIFLSVLLAAASAFACPAYPGTARVQQPDGTYVTIRLVGDEYRSFHTTADGYTLVRDDRGYYVYAQLDSDGRLAPTRQTAHDVAERTANEVAFLQGVKRMLMPEMGTEQATAMRRNRVSRQQALEQRRAAYYDYSKFRGLVILVEYNDCPFLYDDYADIMNKMINQANYTGESRTNVGTVKCTGSMRDYFYDNSNGMFEPSFDVVGPVKIKRSQYYPRPNASDQDVNYNQLIIDAVTAADPKVNFKDYDLDGNGIVDMVYFIFSGSGSNFVDNDQRLLWPHQSDMSYFQVRKDGVYIGRYACSTELYYKPDWGVLDGIGTMTHEFSHVLGLPDLYDTNNVNPDECVTPGEWSVMAGGSYNNYSRTPVGYSLYERYALGFATPQVITEPGEFSMEAIHKSNSGFRLNTPVKKEFFLLENRQKTKWDSGLPGHGMLIFRVDSTNTNAWEYNTVNDNPKHPYYELVRAKGASSTDPSASSSRDPFPGTGRVTAITNDTEPANLLTWIGRRNDFGLRDISEKNGVISFEAYLANVLTEMELPDSITLGMGTTMLLEPVLIPDNAAAKLTWTSDNETVATVSGEGLVAGVSEGTAIITVTSDNGVTATCVATVTAMEEKANIAAFRHMEEGENAKLLLTEAQVLFVNGGDVFVRDSTASIRFSGTGLDATVGKILNGSIFGKLDVKNGMPQLSVVENTTSVSDIVVTDAEEAPLPHDVLHNDSVTNDMLCDLITLKGVTLTLENKMVWATLGKQRVRMYNTFGLKNITSPKTSALAGKYFDVTGILTTDLINDALTYVISLTASVVQVEKPVEKVKGDVNGDGTVDVADIASIISVMADSVGSGSPTADAADVNADGIVDVADIASVISIMAQTSPQ